MHYLHRRIIISGLVMASCLSIHGCAKSTVTPVNHATDSVAETPDKRPKSVEVILNAGWVDCDNDYQDPEGITFMGKLDNDRNAIELLKACNTSHVDIPKLEQLIATGVDLNKTYQVGSKKYSPLEVLCSRSDIDEEAIKILIKHGADINFYSESGFTPLMTACDRKIIDKQALKLLIELSDDINAGNLTNNDSPVMIATDRACYDRGAVKMLLNAGADVNKVAKNGTTLLHSAIRDIEITRQIIEMGASVYPQANNGVDSLILASFYAPPESVSLMISKGLDVNRVLPNGYTALIHAALGNKLDVIKVLEEAGADLEYKTDDGLSLLHFVCQRNEKQITGLRASKVQPDVIQYLIDKGLSVNSEDKEGWTPLMYLLLTNEDVSESVKILLDAGADINHRSANGYTPIMLAQHPNVAKLLIERGADIHANDGGYDALFAAVHHDQPETVKLLVEKGLNINATTEWGDNPLMYAGSVEVADYLLKHGAVINNNSGENESFMTRYLGHHITDVWLARIYGHESPRYKNGQISDEELRKKSYLILYFLEKGAETDEESLPFQALDETLIFDNDEDYKKLFDLYISKNTLSKRRAFPSILEEVLSSTEFRGIKLTPDADSVQKYIQMKGSVDESEILAYLNNEKVTADPKIIDMLMKSYSEDSYILARYLSHRYYKHLKPTSKDSQIIHALLDHDIQLRGDELNYYLSYSHDNADMEIVRKLVKALSSSEEAGDEMLPRYLRDEDLIPQNQIISIMLENGAKAEYDTLSTYLTRVPNPDIKIINGILTASDDEDYSLHDYLNVNTKDITPQNHIIKALLDAKIPMKGDEFINYLVNPRVSFDKDIAQQIYDASSTFNLTTLRRNENCIEEIPIMIPIIEKFPEMLPEMSKFAKNPNVRLIRHCTTSEETLLMSVVSNPELVQFLIEEGVDVNATNSEGETALSRAVKEGYTQSAELIRNAAAAQTVNNSESH